METGRRVQEIGELEYGENPIYVEGVRPWNDYFESPSELHEYCDDEGIAVPPYAWACMRLRFQLPSADALIAEEIEAREHCDDIDAHIVGREALEAAINAFNAAQTAESWFPDYSRRVVMLTDEPAPPASAPEVEHG